MNMQNGHDAKVYTLNPTDNGICQAKLAKVHPLNIPWHLSLAEIFNSPFFAGTHHGLRFTTSVLCNANQFEPQIGMWGRYTTLYKMVYCWWSSKWVSMLAGTHYLVITIIAFHYSWVISGHLILLLVARRGQMGVGKSVCINTVDRWSILLKYFLLFWIVADDGAVALSYIFSLCRWALAISGGVLLC